MEILVALIIISPLVFLVLNIFISHLYHSKTINDKYIADQNIFKTYYLLEKILKDLDLHRFNIPPVIHHLGTIRDSENLPNPINRNKKFAPKLNSTPISAYKLDLNATFIAKNIGTFLTACPKYDHKFKKQKYKSYLAIHSNGFLHITAEVANINNSKCKIFNIKPTKSMFIKNNLKFLKFIKAIIPFEEEYTIYIDKNNILRYLGHKGNINIENQPILEGLKLLDLHISNIFDNNIYLLKASLESKKEYRTFSFTHSLSRSQPYNFLLN